MEGTLPLLQDRQTGDKRETGKDGQGELDRERRWQQKGENICLKGQGSLECVLMGPAVEKRLLVRAKVAGYGGEWVAISEQTTETGIDSSTSARL